MNNIFTFPSWGWRGAQTVINIPGSAGLVLRASGEELSNRVEALAGDFYHAADVSDEFDITLALLRIYAKCRGLCELLAAQEVLVDSSFRYVIVDEETGFVHFSEELPVGPYVEIGDMRMGGHYSQNHMPGAGFQRGLEKMRCAPLATLVDRAEVFVRLVGELCRELSRISSIRGWEAMHIQLLRIYSRSRELVRALTGSSFWVDGFPYAFYTDTGGVEFARELRKALASREAKHLEVPRCATVH